MKDMINRELSGTTHHCKKYYIWNGEECVEAFNSVPVDGYDDGDVAILQYIYDNACINENSSFEEFLNGGRFSFWPDSGRLATANLQHSSAGANDLKLCGENALPENFGNLTELIYLDIGLLNDITRLPESFGNLFNFSIFELTDRNGQLPDMAMSSFGTMEHFNECRTLYENLKFWPDPDYSWQSILDYHNHCKGTWNPNTGSGGFAINLHLDGNNNLGYTGSIPTSMSNMKQLQHIFWGFGSNIPIEQFEFPINFVGWKLTGAFNTGQWNDEYNFDETWCSVLPNQVPTFDWMSGTAPEILLSVFYGSDWNYNTCIDFWNSYQQHSNYVPGGTHNMSRDIQDGVIGAWNAAGGIAYYVNNDKETVIMTECLDTEGSGNSASCTSGYQTDLRPDLSLNTENAGNGLNKYDPSGARIWTTGGNLGSYQSGNPLNQKWLAGLMEGPKIQPPTWPDPENQPENNNWSWVGGNLYLNDHHDSWTLPNGRIIVHGNHKLSTNDRLLLAGNSSCGRHNSAIFILIIEPVGFDDFNVVWEWYSVDHSIHTNPEGPIENYVENINTAYNKIDFCGSPFNEESHTNTIHWNAEKDQIIISSRHFNEFYVIQHTTGQSGGDIVFRCCTPENYGAPPYDWGGTEAQHGANFIPHTWPDGGDILVFNNIESGTMWDLTARSSILKIRPALMLPDPTDNDMIGGMCAVEDIDGLYRYEIADLQKLTQMNSWIEPDWNTHNGEFYASQMSCVRGLPNGNIITTISWGAGDGIPYPNGGVVEVSNPFTNPTVVWEQEGNGIAGTSGWGNTQGCITKYVYGCADPAASNYDPAADYGYMINDGSCEYTDTIPGDINDDGIVNVVDIVSLVNCILEITDDCHTQEMPFTFPEAMDLNSDGIINVVDVVQLVNWILRRGVSSSEQQELNTALQRLINSDIPTQSEKQQLQQQMNRLSGIPPSSDVKPIPKDKKTNILDKSNKRFKKKKKK